MAEIGPRRPEPEYDATPTQKRKLTQLSAALRLTGNLDYRKLTKGEAGRLIRELSQELKRRRQKGGKV